MAIVQCVCGLEGSPSVKLGVASLRLKRNFIERGAMRHGTLWTTGWIPRQVPPVATAPATTDELDQAIIRMVHMARDLSGLSADASGARLAVDEVMRYYEYLRWTQD